MSKKIELGAHDTCVILRSDGSSELVPPAIKSDAGMAGIAMCEIMLAVAGNPALSRIVAAIVSGRADVAILGGDMLAGDCDCEDCAPSVRTNAPGGSA